LQGTQYSFTPTATDPDGNTLTFSITNRPSWATFNASNGQLQGTPEPADIGSYPNITIRVSDGLSTASLSSFAIQVVGTATGTATLNWYPPTTNTDASALTNLAGFKVYWGTARDNYTNSVTINNPSVTTYVVEQLTPATWYFATSAVNSLGAESGRTSPVSKTIR
jgi:hypothetical protein